jgi:hypothetical protein
LFATALLTIRKICVYSGNRDDDPLQYRRKITPNNKKIRATGMTQGFSMDYALATDGYYFSTEPFQDQQQIEATQLACLLDINADSLTEVILEVRVIEDTSRFQLALSGPLHIIDQQQRPVTCQQLRQLPLEQLCEKQLISRGWTIVKRPHFVWLNRQQPLDYRATTIQTCAVDQLNSLRLLLQQAA